LRITVSNIGALSFAVTLEGVAQDEKPGQALDPCPAMRQVDRTRPRSPAMTLPAPIRVDIVSDVVCPWCIIGFLQLQQACQATGRGLEVHWHPFELNPDMGPEGENLRDHLIGKYAITAEASAEARNRLTDLGRDLGFAFAFTDDSRIVNTFRAHQLIRWAGLQGLGHQAKMALFAAHFTQGRDVNDLAVLEGIATDLGLDGTALRAAIGTGEMTEDVRREERASIEQGITGVPAMLFDGKFLVTGAQGAENYARVLDHVEKNRAA
jgi:predicted DsbA family dithiol-disulfide isomerase